MTGKECSQQRYHPHTGYNMRRFTRRKKLPDTLVFLHCTFPSVINLRPSQVVAGKSRTAGSKVCWQVVLGKIGNGEYIPYLAVRYKSASTIGKIVGIIG
jgi:hypothetical protein